MYDSILIRKHFPALAELCLSSCLNSVACTYILACGNSTYMYSSHKMWGIQHGRTCLIIPGATLNWTLSLQLQTWQYLSARIGLFIFTLLGRSMILAKSSWRSSLLKQMGCVNMLSMFKVRKSRWAIISLKKWNLSCDHAIKRSTPLVVGQAEMMFMSYFFLFFFFFFSSDSSPRRPNPGIARTLSDLHSAESTVCG